MLRDDFRRNDIDGNGDFVCRLVRRARPHDDVDRRELDGRPQERDVQRDGLVRLDGDLDRFRREADDLRSDRSRAGRDSGEGVVP